MLARIFTRLFYAAVFFALGVWAAPSIGNFGGLIDSGLSSGFDRLWSWAESTISTTPAAKTAPAAPLPVPAAKPSSAAVPPVPAPAVDSIDAARGAHSRGDIATAVRLYEDLIAKRPDDVGLRGELGNVYWAAGRLQEAAKSYYGAALTLIAARRLDEAKGLEGAVRKGDPALADDLARRLAEAARAK